MRFDDFARGYVWLVDNAVDGDAFWEWRLAMRGHAGNHAIGAIHAWRLKTGQSERVNG